MIIRAQVVMFGSLAVCVALKPGFLFSRNMGGVSNYGVQALTVAPYTAGTVVGVWLLWRAAMVLRPVSEARRVVLVTRLACACLLVNLVTTYPYKSGELWAMVHSWTAIALALVEFVGGTVVLRSVAVPVWRRGVLVLLVVGFSGLFLTYVGRLHVLFVAEVITAVGFGVALVAAVRTSPATTVDRVVAGTAGVVAVEAGGAQSGNSMSKESSSRLMTRR